MLSNDFEDDIDLNDLPSFDDLPPLHRPDATIIVEHALPDPVPGELPPITETVTHHVLEGGSTRGKDVVSFVLYRLTVSCSPKGKLTKVANIGNVVIAVE